MGFINLFQSNLLESMSDRKSLLPKEYSYWPISPQRPTPHLVCSFSPSRQKERPPLPPHPGCRRRATAARLGTRVLGQAPRVRPSTRSRLSCAAGRRAFVGRPSNLCRLPQVPCLLKKKSGVIPQSSARCSAPRGRCIARPTGFACPPPPASPSPVPLRSVRRAL